MLGYEEREGSIKKALYSLFHSLANRALLLRYFPTVSRPILLPLGCHPLPNMAGSINDVPPSLEAVMKRINELAVGGQEHHPHLTQIRDVSP